MRELRDGTGMKTVRRASLVCAVALVAAACGGNSGNENTIATDSAGTTASTATGTVGGDTMAGMAGGAGATGGAMAGGGSLSDPSTSAQLDSVATAARSGLTNLSPTVAVPLLRSLEGKLQGSGNQALSDIATDLGSLRTALEAGTPNGTEIAGILERLGPKVTNVAGQAGPAQSTVSAIGSELTKAATSLRGGSR